MVLTSLVSEPGFLFFSTGVDLMGALCPGSPGTRSLASALTVGVFTCRSEGGAWVKKNPIEATQQEHTAPVLYKSSVKAAFRVCSTPFNTPCLLLSGLVLQHRVIRLINASLIYACLQCNSQKTKNTRISLQTVGENN